MGGETIMAKKTASAPESNTGLIVALVIFVLLTLTLGVFTYFGYDGQKQLAEEAKKEKTNATNARAAADEEKVRRLVLAIATGNEGPNDQRELGSLKGQAKLAGVFTQATAALKDIKWNAAQDRPDETYQDKIAKLSKERDTALNEKRVAEKNLVDAKAEFDVAIKTHDDKAKEAAKNLKEAQDKALADRQKEHDDYVQLIAKIDQELSEALKNEKQNRADDNAAADRERKKLAERIDSFQKQVDRLKSEIAPPTSIDADTPKGQILRVDRKTNTAFIDLGSADNLKPKVTFSVFAANATNKTAEKRERKGTIEVVTILEPHLAQVRITDVVNELRDPILAGDLIFNPSWSPNQREHIALAGIFDLDGDGYDDTPELVRNLERQGIVVDAWLDLKERTIKGPGITERTEYLVLGERPQMSEALSRQSATNPDHPVAQGVIQINNKIAEMEAQAKEKGVEKAAYRRYLNLIGYKLPKTIRPLDLTSSTYVRGTTASSAPADEADKPK
jgi:hypothetical protein